MNYTNAPPTTKQRFHYILVFSSLSIEHRFREKQIDFKCDAFKDFIGLAGRRMGPMRMRQKRLPMREGSLISWMQESKFHQILITKEDADNFSV